MHTYIIIILLAIAATQTQAQTTTHFNKTFKPDTMNILSPAVLVTEDGYLLATSFNSLNNYEALAVRKIDLEGNTVWFKIVEEGNTLTGIVGGGILEKTIDGNYIMVGLKDTIGISGNLDIIMIKFNEHGDVIWKKTHGTSTTVEGIYHITPTQDGGYIMCGIQRGFTTSNRFYVLKTDAFGNKEWDRVYNPAQHASAFSIFETNAGYIVSGFMYNALTNYDMVIMQIDKLGNVLWQKFYGSNESDSGCLLSPTFGENSYLVISSIKESNKKKPYVFAIDTLGNIIWQKIIDLEVRALQEAPMFRTNNGGAICIYGFNNQLSNTDARIFHLTSTGDTLWTRTIPGLNPQDNWYLKDIAPTADGGYILSGFNYSQQSSWVVKTDSLGYTCSYLGCDSIATISSVPPQTPPLKKGGQGQGKRIYRKLI